VLVPAAAGVLSALGLAASEERRDRVVSVVRPLAEAGDVPREGEADHPYPCQSFELTVSLGGDLAAAFHRAHEERYGYADPDREIELVAVRTADVVPGPAVSLRATTRRQTLGPVLYELDGATCWVPEGWEGETNGDGTLVLSR
jgi:N-methylhydantoinase A/oxoprolinase/acetone carboxylase beta subunit